MSMNNQVQRQQNKTVPRTLTCSKSSKAILLLFVLCIFALCILKNDISWSDLGSYLHPSNPTSSNSDSDSEFDAHVRSVRSIRRRQVLVDGECKDSVTIRLEIKTGSDPDETNFQLAKINLSDESASAFKEIEAWDYLDKPDKIFKFDFAISDYCTNCFLYKIDQSKNGNGYSKLFLLEDDVTDDDEELNTGDLIHETSKSSEFFSFGKC